DNFETDLGTWTLGAGWSRTPSEGGQALQVVNSAEPVTFVRSDIYDGAVQARFLLNGGAAGLSVRQSAAGSYTATLDSSGSVRLYRSGALFGEAVVPFTAGQWYTL